MKVLVIFLVLIGFIVIIPHSFAENTNWSTIPVIGEYRNWEMYKEPDIFNLKYQIINGTITSIESVPTLTVFDIVTDNDGYIQLKVPKNYPFTNYPQEGRERDALYVKIDGTGIDENLVDIKNDDCFYNYSIPFTKTDSTVEIGFSKTLGFNPYVIEEVPDFCNEVVFAKPPFPRHILIEFSPLMQTQLGISYHEIQCEENLVLIQKYDGSPACVTESTKQKLIERGWTKLLPPCTSDRTACFNQESNICDPSGWDCGNGKVFSETIPMPEREIEYFQISDPCYLDCKERLETEQNFTCNKIDSTSYGCKAEITTTHPELIYMYVIPPELGEYYLIPSDGKISLGALDGVSLLSENSIRVDFKNGYGKDSIVLKKNQIFISECNDYKNIYVWTFTNTTKLLGENYIEMHKRLAKIPDNYDCSKPIQILK